jgi:hypothetical protein
MSNSTYSTRSVIPKQVREPVAHLPSIPIPTSHAHTSGIHIVRAGDVITEIQVTCSCGETHSIQCGY